MSNGTITVNPQDLKATSEAYEEAGRTLAQAKDSITSTAANPTFGLVMQPIQPAYLVARSMTASYLESLGDICNLLALKMRKAADDFEQTEQNALDRIKELQGALDGIDIGDGGDGGDGHDGNDHDGGDRTDDGKPEATEDPGFPVTPSTPGDGGGTSVGTPSAVGPGSGSGSASAPTVPFDGAASTPGGASGTGNGSGNDAGKPGQTIPGTAIPTPDKPGAGTDANAGDGTGNRPGADGQSRQGGNVYIDTDGDGAADYSINVTPGTNLNGTVRYDSAGAHVEFGKNPAAGVGTGSGAGAGSGAGVDAQGVPLPNRESTGAATGTAHQGTAAGADAGLALDTDGDGAADMNLTVEQDRDTMISFGGTEGDRVVSVDFDHDGDVDARYAVPDDASNTGTSDASASNASGANTANASVTNAPDANVSNANAPGDDQAERLAWDVIAKDDPLGRSGEELRQLFEDRDPITFDDDDVLGGAAATGAAGTPVQMPAQTGDATKGGNGSWIAY